MDKSRLDKAYIWIVLRKHFIIYGFQIFQAAVVLSIFTAFYLAFSGNAVYQVLAKQSVLFGKTALTLYILTLVPGITGRLGIRHKLLSLLMIFRRHIGILMYLFALLHFSFLFLIPQLIIGNKLFDSLLLFEFMGLSAIMLLLFLFLTSNDFSQFRLKDWWYLLHKLTYIAMFFIFLHVALQRISIWTILMGVIIFLQISSFLYSFLKRREQ